MTLCRPTACSVCLFIDILVTTSFMVNKSYSESLDEQLQRGEHTAYFPYIDNPGQKRRSLPRFQAAQIIIIIIIGDIKQIRTVIQLSNS